MDTGVRECNLATVRNGLRNFVEVVDQLLRLQSAPHHVTLTSTHDQDRSLASCSTHAPPSKLELNHSPPHPPHNPYPYPNTNTPRHYVRNESLSHKRGSTAPSAALQRPRIPTPQQSAIARAERRAIPLAVAIAESSRCRPGVNEPDLGPVAQARYIAGSLTRLLRKDPKTPSGPRRPATRSAVRISAWVRQHTRCGGSTHAHAATCAASRCVGTRVHGPAARSHPAWSRRPSSTGP
jgi:hypothetical protein